MKMNAHTHIHTHVHKRNIQEIWDNKRKSNLQIASIDEKEWTQINDTNQVFNNIIEENSCQLKKKISIQIQEAQ